MMTAVFVTATGTDIGKTFIARGMIGELRARGRSVEALKPVITGFDPGAPQMSDTGHLLLALGETLTPERIAAASPYRLREPLSPDIAARREGTAIDFAALTARSHRAVAAHRDALIIEGIGGIMVPLDDRHTVLDWMIELDLPLILAAGSYVGTLSHTLTALDVLDRADLRVAAVVVNETPGSAATLEDTVATIRRFAVGIEVLALPRLPEGTLVHPVMAALADLM
jgi:dethiobiotin synthetase